MRLSREYKGVAFSKAFNLVRHNKQIKGKPILIVRTDVVKKVYKMRSFLAKIDNCIYIKLGVAYSMDKIYRILLEQLMNGKKIMTNDQNQIVNLITQSLAGSRGQHLLVIDNCQHLSFQKIFRLAGLMLETVGKVQFVFLLPEEYLTKWRLLDGFREIIFLNLITFKYDFTKK